jgi:hypothetical protein
VQLAGRLGSAIMYTVNTQPHYLLLVDDPADI